MDPATLLMLLGAFYAMKTGLKAVKAGSHSSSAAALPRSGGRRKSSSTSTSTGGGMPRWLTTQRHTGSGWWASEIGHGFPVFRSGLSEGWTHHQTAMHQRQAQAAKAKADGTTRQLTYKQETSQHRQRMADAQQVADARKADPAANLTPCPVCGLYFSHLTGYSCSGQPPANETPAEPAKPAPASQPPARPVMAPPPSGGSNGSSGRGGQPAARPANGGDMQHADYPHEPGRLYDCPACEASCHCKPGETECVYSGKHNGLADDSQPTGNKPGGNPTDGGSMSDTTYESTESTLEKILGLLDHMFNDAAVGEMETLADALPSMLPDDSETVGHVADAAAAVKESRDAQARAQDAIQAAQTSHETHNRASKEAADAQGGAPERGYVTGG